MKLSSLELPLNIVSLRLFGSHCRGDYDALSDIDVLAIYDNKPSLSDRARTKDTLSTAFGQKVDLAEYSPSRLGQIFASGHLFAWHLIAESKNLLDTPDTFFDSLSTPKPYLGAQSDAKRFYSLLRTVPEQLNRQGSSTPYEGGLAYLAVRNIGLCTSWHIYRKPDFSRYSCQNVAERLGVTFPISRQDFSVLIDCRFATIRGLNISMPKTSKIEEIVRNVIGGCSRIYEIAFRESLDGN